jgi:hypothetical protein
MHTFHDLPIVNHRRAGDEHISKAAARHGTGLVRCVILNRRRIDNRQVRVGTFLDAPFPPRAGRGCDP